MTRTSNIAPRPHLNYYGILAVALYSTGTDEDLFSAVTEVGATSSGFISGRLLEDYESGLKDRCQVRGPLAGGRRWMNAVFHETGYHSLTLETGDASGTTRYIRASLVEESDLGALKIDPEDAPDICDWNHWARDFVMQRIYLAPMVAAIDYPVDHDGRTTLGTRRAAILWLPILLDTLSAPPATNDTICISARVLHPTGPGDRYGIDARLVYTGWEHFQHPNVCEWLSWLVFGTHPQEFLFQPSAQHVAFARDNIDMPELVKERFAAPRGISATPDDPWDWINIYRC